MKCPSGKTIYNTEKQAKGHAKAIAGHKFGSRKKKMRVYHCDLCNQWHLTKEIKEFSRKGRRK